jgi:asparagine synthase (glutamine-hydrolysing)
MDTGTVYEWLRRSACGDPVFWGSADAMKDVAKKQLLSSRLLDGIGKRTSWDAIEPIHTRFMNKAWETSPLNWMSYLDLSMRLPELLLMRVDKMSMGMSLEARVPFLDHKFVELAMSIPSEMKLRGNTTKYLLKKAVRGLIPDEVIDRPKQPFNVPIMEWFFERLGATARESINDFARNTDLLDTAEVERLFRQNKSAHLWILLNLAMWWRTFIANPISTSEAA